MTKFTRAVGAAGAGIVLVGVAAETTLMRERSVVLREARPIVRAVERAFPKLEGAGSRTVAESRTTAERVAGLKPSPPTAPPPRPLPGVQLPHADDLHGMNFTAAHDALSTVYNRAATPITDQLHALGNGLTEQDIVRVLQQELANAFETSKPAGEPWFNFEVLSGKLRIPKLQKMAGGKLNVGEANVYKTAAAVAGVAYACKGLSLEQFRKCISSSVHEALDNVSHELEASAQATELTDGTK